MNIKYIKLGVLMVFIKRMLDAFNLNEIVESFVEPSACDLEVFSFRYVRHRLVLFFK
jgi:hypothetical protein